MRWALLCMALLIGGAGIAIYSAHEARREREAAQAAVQRRLAEALRGADRVLGNLTPQQQAEDACEARARMAAAVHRADPAQVREACLFTWRTTGAMPR